MVDGDWEDAWARALEFLDADRWLGFGHHVTVKPVTISAGPKRARRVWGIFLISPDPEN